MIVANEARIMNHKGKTHMALSIISPNVAFTNLIAKSAECGGNCNLAASSYIFVPESRARL